MKTMYEAQARAEAGREGRVWSEDGHVDLALAPPKAMGGSGAGTNPEQLFAAGYAACFHSAMLFVAREAKLDTGGSSVEGHVAIGMNDAGPGFKLAVRHSVHLPGLPQAEAEALVAKAHAVCPYSNATRGNIDVDFDVKGAA
ncbi:peroxiredoxin OhrA [Polymorphobacter multimanifer]|uniref:Osmotically inducible protein OsmC n=1 Tax=Polymorphobacter multimanifer TaxID=1070431 RepID=A0A841L2W0_9SPHN|nr:organic hydroperoxide resistance protein [Polymorphobacter multimanifer]MBB6226760.1 osmotically inducible protein OsmC [Polymorphobacter multimanifer]GGI71421.1 peroxiredoxin OhrA [Polymorphobacter multimanifer]